MTGFKSGSAGDPFSGDRDDEDVDDEPDEAEASTVIDAEPSPDLGQRRDDDRGETEPTASVSSSGLPWIYERDSITDDRTTVQLHLQDTSVNREREGKADVEAVLGESVKKADLREAALLVGLEHVDEIADQLREWGYDFE